jgi:hypothetical protein
LAGTTQKPLSEFVVERVYSQDDENEADALSAAVSDSVDEDRIDGVGGDAAPSINSLRVTVDVVILPASSSTQRDNEGTADGDGGGGGTGDVVSVDNGVAAGVSAIDGYLRLVPLLLPAGASVIKRYAFDSTLTRGPWVHCRYAC